MLHDANFLLCLYKLINLTSIPQNTTLNWFITFSLKKKILFIPATAKQKFGKVLGSPTIPMKSILRIDNVLLPSNFPFLKTETCTTYLTCAQHRNTKCDKKY